MGFKRFEDITAWQKAQDFIVDIYSVFGNCKDFGFRDQITRATFSISNNIAEGFDRGYEKDFLRFLRIAKGSGSEVKSMLYAAPKIGFCSTKEATLLLDKITEINKILGGLIKSIEKRIN